MAEEIKGDRVEETFADGTKSSSDDDPEHQLTHNGQEKRGNVSEELKLDSNGLPLVPQPSRFKDDPLVSTDCFPPQSRCMHVTNEHCRIGLHG